LGYEGKEVTKALKVIATTDPIANPTVGKKGNIEPDTDLRDNENIELPENYLELEEEEKIKEVRKLADIFFEKEIKKYVPDAWVDHTKTKIGYEIPFTRQFYTYIPPKPVDEIRMEIQELEKQIQAVMRAIL